MTRFFQKGILFIAGISLTMQVASESVYTIHNGELRVGVSATGAELQHIVCRGKEYLWQGDPHYWRGRAPLMFPVNVRYREDAFSFRGRQYKMPRMGILAGAILTGSYNADSSALRLIYRSNDSILREHYPFPFELVIDYTLKGRVITTSMTLENTGNDTLYYALGAHPGFGLTLNDSLTRGGYEISFADRKRSLTRTTVSNGLLRHETEAFLTNEKSIRLDDGRIAGTGMFFDNQHIRKVGIGLAGHAPFLEIDTGNFPHLNFWSPPGMPFVCIEPMVSHHDFVDSPMDIRDKSQLLQLLPHKKAHYYYRIMIR